MPTISKALQSQIFKRGLKRHLLRHKNTKNRNELNKGIHIFDYLISVYESNMNKKIDTNSYSYRELYSMRNDIPFGNGRRELRSE
jgi:hypothetical protein